jgi:hypothetical protein
MHAPRVPSALRERLGEAAADGLVEFVDETRQKWTADVIAIVTDRFERRLTEEMSKLRVEMAQGFASVRQEMAQGLGAVRQEMAQHRVELLKWAFLFWAGQLFAVASLTALLIRILRPGV